MGELRGGSTIGGFLAIHFGNLLDALKAKLPKGSGSGSGIDVDFLDGKDATDFASQTDFTSVKTEVANARISTKKSTTYTALDDRLEAAEIDIETLKVTGGGGGGGGISRIIPFSYTATANTTVFTVSTAGFDSTIDALWLVYHNTLLIKDNNYSVSGANVTLGFTLDASDSIYGFIFKGALIDQATVAQQQQFLSVRGVRYNG
jgi:hypothetical protein